MWEKFSFLCFSSLPAIHRADPPWIHVRRDPSPPSLCSTWWPSTLGSTLGDNSHSTGTRYSWYIDGFMEATVRSFREDQLNSLVGRNFSSSTEICRLSKFPRHPDCTWLVRLWKSWNGCWSCASRSLSTLRDLRFSRLQSRSKWLQKSCMLSFLDKSRCSRFGNFRTDKIVYLR